MLGKVSSEEKWRAWNENREAQKQLGSIMTYIPFSSLRYFSSQNLHYLILYYISVFFIEFISFFPPH